MKNLLLTFGAAFCALVLMGNPTVVFGQSCEEGPYATEAELPRIDALIFESDGATIYGQILVPAPKFGTARPCAIFCHGFAGFTRWDDVAHELCRAGIVVVIPHHRGAWGSEGEYTVTGCIRDAENLASWAMSAETAAKYGIDPSAVWLVGHSMGGNTAVNAAARLPGLKGVVLMAPCDIGFMAGRMEKDELKNFLIGEGMHALHRASDDAIVEDIFANAENMRFTRAAKSFAGKRVFLVTGEYDLTVPTEPLDAFWAALPDDTTRKREQYHSGHSLMGSRLTFAGELKEFILKDQK
ncbi:MAG: alpha/beta fold hydrolase [Thermoguttaceae bacterium]|nr:alpha/beta fold hydrolase [Thermoguttaceae bacterium]